MWPKKGLPKIITGDETCFHFVWTQGYETERKLWKKKHMAQQTTFACITAKRGKATMKGLYEMFFNCNVAVACSDSRQKSGMCCKMCVYS